ncbi:hypothetical protein ES703_83850 [subsurface metagenome]
MAFDWSFADSGEYFDRALRWNGRSRGRNSRSGYSQLRVDCGDNSGFCRYFLLAEVSTKWNLYNSGVSGISLQSSCTSDYGLLYDGDIHRGYNRGGHLFRRSDAADDIWRLGQSKTSIVWHSGHRRHSRTIHYLGWIKGGGLGGPFSGLGSDNRGSDNDGTGLYRDRQAASID